METKPLNLSAQQALLTDDEIRSKAQAIWGMRDFGALEFARAIESALLSKLRAPVADEPTHEMYAAAQRVELQYGDETFILNTSQIRAVWKAMQSASMSEMAGSAEFERTLDVYGFRCERFGQSQSSHARAQVVAAALASAPVAGEAHQEEWRPVVGFEGLYEASSLGAVRSVSSGRVLSRNALAGDGYVKTDLHRDGVRTHGYLHRIVAETFHGPAAGREVNHKNGDKLDNRAANLEWVTRAENEIHSRYVLGNLCSRVIAINIHSGDRMEFPSHAQAERELGINKDTVRRCLVGELKQTKGWRFERPAPQASEAQCSCPSGDGSLRHPCALHPQASEAVSNEDVATVLNFIFEHFGKPFNACDLPGYVVAAVRRLEHAALSAQPGAQKGGSDA